MQDFSFSVCNFSPLRTPDIKNRSKLKVNKQSASNACSDTESVVTRDLIKMATGVSQALLTEDVNNNTESDMESVRSQDLFLTQKFPNMPNTNKGSDIEPTNVSDMDSDDSSEGPRSPVIEFLNNDGTQSQTDKVDDTQTLRQEFPGFKECVKDDFREYIPSSELEGKQLFWIQSPWDFDISSLDGKKIPLDKLKKIAVEEEKDVQTEYEILAQTSKQIQDSSTYFSTGHNEQGKFVLGPSVGNQLTIMRSLEDPEPITLREYVPPNHDIPSDLRPRYKPFGSDSPVHTVPDNDAHFSSPSKKKKKRKSEKVEPDQETEVVIDNTDSADIEPEKKKKKKKKKKKHNE